MRFTSTAARSIDLIRAGLPVLSGILMHNNGLHGLPEDTAHADLGLQTQLIVSI